MNSSQKAMATSSYGYASMKELNKTFDSRAPGPLPHNEDTQSLWKIAARAN